MNMFKISAIVLIMAILSNQALAFGRNDRPLESQVIKVLSYDLWNNGLILKNSGEILEDASEIKSNNSVPEELKVPMSNFFGQEQN